MNGVSPAPRCLRPRPPGVTINKLAARPNVVIATNPKPDIYCMFYLKWSNLYRRFESDAHGFCDELECDLLQILHPREIVLMSGSVTFAGLSGLTKAVNRSCRIRLRRRRPAKLHDVLKNTNIL